ARVDRCADHGAHFRNPLMSTEALELDLRISLGRLCTDGRVVEWCKSQPGCIACRACPLADRTAARGHPPSDLTDDLRAMLAPTPDPLRAQPHRALLPLGFPGAFRRSELVALNVEDLEFQRNGVVVTLRRSKTDQEGESRRIGVPYGSSELTGLVRALLGLLECYPADLTRGPVFRAVDRHGNLGE